jgi:hypothetical protein
VAATSAAASAGIRAGSAKGAAQAARSTKAGDGRKAAQALLGSLVRQEKGKVIWWQHFEPILLKHKGKPWEHKFKCIRGHPELCGALLSVRNPSKLVKRVYQNQMQLFWHEKVGLVNACL